MQLEAFITIQNIEQMVRSTKENNSEELIHLHKKFVIFCQSRKIARLDYKTKKNMTCTDV